MPPSSYLTIARDGEAETEVKRSRFLCWLRRVEDEDAARRMVEQARKQHWDARHHCSAFVLGPDARIRRSHDDGEPSGTAGAPMLEVLRGRAVSDVAAVVIRYFGGTLLGAGGLVRAYSDAVRTALDEVGVVRRRQVRLLDVATGHADAGRLEHEMRARGVAVCAVEYGERATLRLGVPLDDLPAIEELLASATGGAARPREVGTDWVDVPARH
ncbi:MAG TPA: YigZ family protein [Nocardioidaceae bacterium]|nr:YigZ family protein [Nocardioidaceae bacterium]